MNSLFPDEPDEVADHGYVLPHGSGRKIEPARHDGEGANQAIDLVRAKIDALYAGEPNAREELAENAAEPTPRTKHQQFMHDLSTSGKSLAEIQTAWHNYYVHLPNEEKQQVWQEFYAANARHPSAYTKYVQQHAQPAKQIAKNLPPELMPEQAPTPPATPEGMVVVSEHMATEPRGKVPRNRSVATIKKHVLKNVRLSENAQRKAKHHLQSLLFGLSLGALVLLVFLFGFFNEVIIAPFIQPGSHASATPIILSTSDVAPTATPEVIIPKINVELPVIYGTSSNENDIENSLQDGVIHYPTTSVPGQQGNAAFFGHSSNNIFNPGKYKFAFVLLHTLVPGDIFYLTNNGKVYTYKVYDKQIVEPTQTSVLNPVPDKIATATLITCDPPGTSLHRLVVWGEQISPDPSANAAAPSAEPAGVQPTTLPSNGPTLWSRIWNSIF